MIETNNIKINKRIFISLPALVLPFIILAQPPSTVAFSPRYANTLPKPVLFRGPYLQAATSNSIIVRWTTESLSRSRVRFGAEEGKWICGDGVTLGHFRMMKNVNNKTVVNAKKGDAITLTASFVGGYEWSPGKQITKSITIKPSAGKSIYTVRDSQNCVVETFEVKTSK